MKKLTKEIEVILSERFGKDSIIVTNVDFILVCTDEKPACNSRFTRFAENARSDFWTTPAGNGMMEPHKRRVAIP